MNGKPDRIENGGGDRKTREREIERREERGERREERGERRGERREERGERREERGERGERGETGERESVFVNSEMKNKVEVIVYYIS